MDVLVITYALNGIIMVAMPIGLAIILTRRWKVGWGVWWIGVGSFVLSQMVHIPFNWGVGQLLNRSEMVYWSSMAQAIFNAIFLGLSAGLFEEGARYFVLQVWGKAIRSWRRGIVFGAGHGGAESIIFGILSLYGFLQLIILRQATPEQLVRLVGTEKVSLVQSQLITAWSAPWYFTILGALERFFTIPIQIFLAVLVLQAVSRKQVRWLFLAVFIHALVDGLVVFLQPYLNVLVLEGLIGIFAVASVIATKVLYQPDLPKDPELTTPNAIRPFEVKPLDETKENLEDSRFLG